MRKLVQLLAVIALLSAFASATCGLTQKNVSAYDVDSTGNAATITYWSGDFGCKLMVTHISASLLYTGGNAAQSVYLSYGLNTGCTTSTVVLWERGLSTTSSSHTDQIEATFPWSFNSLDVPMGGLLVPNGFNVCLKFAGSGTSQTEYINLVGFLTD